MTTETFTIDNLTIRIEQDDCLSSNPREWDNIGTMACWHRKYTLGDVQPTCDPGEYLLGLMQERERRFGKDVPDSIPQRNLEAYINKHFYVLPLYLYDHSGISMATTPFSCMWDSGQVGIIHAERLKAREETTDPIYCLTGEVIIYDQYLRGDIYQYVITNERGDVLDSCCGIFGIGTCRGDATVSARSIAQQLTADFCI